MIVGQSYVQIILLNDKKKSYIESEFKLGQMKEKFIDIVTLHN
jgi:hypothetical protein